MFGAWVQMCDCGGIDYVEMWGYPQPPHVYPHFYPQGYLPAGHACGILSKPEGGPGFDGGLRVERALEIAVRGRVYGPLQDPCLREFYAPFIPELRLAGLCGK